MATVKPKLFYSYSHKDERFREALEQTLALLKRRDHLTDWSDRRILPGQPIGNAIRKQMDSADIVVFLLSPDFLASDACLEEWERSRNTDTPDRLRFRVPIILRPCAWQDLLGSDDIKALPIDGKPISAYGKPDTAWHEVYEGIKSVVDRLRRTFTPKPSFLKDLERTDITSQSDIQLSQVFVQLTLSRVRDQDDDTGTLIEDKINRTDRLLSQRRCLIHGPDMSGKTSLARHIYLTLVRQREHVLFVDLEKYRGNHERIVQDAYEDQFNGDFALWSSEPKRTIVIDNLTSAPAQVNFVASVGGDFDRVFVTLATDTFFSYFRDDIRLTEFRRFSIEPLTRVQQEQLIRDRIGLMEQVEVTDGSVDQFERRVEAVIANGIVPRYPFYVLSILQTFEAFMPKNLSITSYGHCYYVLIVASLIKAGIANRDEDINVCLNFAEHLAFEVFQSKRRSLSFGADDFDAFVKKYRSKYLLRNSILNRLKGNENGILNADGTFRVPYMQHFFLGAYLAKPQTDRREIVDELCQRSHVVDNHLTLLFVIHHAVDEVVIEKIIDITTKSLPHTASARLDEEETARFSDVVAALPKEVLSHRTVGEERRRDRETLDSEVDDDVPPESEIDEVNDWYKIWRNIDILGHVLRVRYGKMTRDRIGEVVETVAEGGLRVVNSILKDEDEIVQLAEYLAAKNPEADLVRIRRLVRLVSFYWTMVNVERVVPSIGNREIRTIVSDVIDRKGTVAYDIIGYFGLLDGADQLTDGIKDRLDLLLKRHEDQFVRRVLSIRTQFYMNTHRSKAVVEQRFCSSLEIPYRHRPR